jgi:hypothetical protein
MLKRIEIMKGSKHIQSIEIRASPSLDGYHCIVNTFDKIPRNYEYFLRREWWDDIRRLNNDMLSFNKARNVLFQKKIYKNMEFKELLMIVISRKSLNHNWDEKIYDKTQNVLERWL